MRHNSLAMCLGSDWMGAATMCYVEMHLESDKTVWPSGLRRWLQAPVRKGVGSNPTAVIAQHSFKCVMRAMWGSLVRRLLANFVFLFGQHACGMHVFAKLFAMTLACCELSSISGLVVEYIVAIDVTRVRFPADALFVRLCACSFLQ